MSKQHPADTTERLVERKNNAVRVEKARQQQEWADFQAQEALKPPKRTKRR